MNPFNDDFVNTYQKILFEDEGGQPKKTADVIRKCTALSYSASLNTFDNQSTSQLLKWNLNKLSKVVHSGKDNIYDSELKSIPDKHKPISTSIDVQSCLQSLSCSNGNKICHSSENVSADDFEEFRTLFHKNRTKGVLNEPSTHTFAKKFAPQTCISKERKFMRHNSLEHQKEVSESEDGFKTARDLLNPQNKQGGQSRKLGIRRRVSGKFVSPMLANSDNGEDSLKPNEEKVVDERLKHIDQRMVELIKSEIMDCGPSIDWNDISGLEFAKTAIQEAVVWPMLRPDIFTGLRRPPKGILLFGPPGTGKTLIGKCVASQSKSTFFSISASSLTSKWVGDGEKMVRALFAVARCHQPAVIFIDEIDSLLSQRSDTEHESSRRIKTEFLIQLDGATTDTDERLLVIGATNRPQELDEAARRRFVKRLYIPLPELKARFQLVQRLMCGEKHNLTEENLMEIARSSDGYSGADMRNVCADASLGPIRCMDMGMIQSIQNSEVRPVFMEDFKKALSRVKSSVAPNDLEQYIKWDKTYGSGNFF